ncbi:hypothetical protein ACJMK2_005936 [Sinanodonta woodiana]|uniref:Uncharacterized protein n=1 Tax=Sinanodonta woodiana TaxID=1069815 RepID=A0ABD3VUR6_SINWO
MMFGRIVVITMCLVFIHGAPSSITPATAPSVCGNKNYRKWHVSCGNPCKPAKESTTTEIKAALGNISLCMKEAQDMIKVLKDKYNTDRIKNSKMVENIESKTEYAFKNGKIEKDERKVKSSNVTEMIKADYDSMAAAIMFTEQLRFNEDSSKLYGQLSKNLNDLSDKLATILCDFEIIQCRSGSVPSTNITCQSTVAGSVQSWTTEETRILVEYWVLRDLGKYISVLIPKYELK